MRSLAIALTVALTTAPALGADKDEDKAKEVAVALLKAVQARDADAVMKLTAVPFTYRDGDKPKLIKETADVKAWVKGQLGQLKDGDRVSTEVERVTPFAALREKIPDAAVRRTLEEVIGKHGFMAYSKASGGKQLVVIVRIQDGKAIVVGIAH